MPEENRGPWSKKFENRWSGAALKLAQRVRAEPGRQTVFGEFQAKNLASSSNDLQELNFQELNHKNWGDWVAECHGSTLDYIKTVLHLNHLMTKLRRNLNCLICDMLFYRAMLCIRGTSHRPVSVCVCPSVYLCLSQVRVLLKRQNTG